MTDDDDDITCEITNMSSNVNYYCIVFNEQCADTSDT